MQVTILGIGAMGCLFGSRLSAHADVTLIGSWPEQIEALQRGPLRVIAPDGREEQALVRVATRVEGLAAADLVLILTKAYKTAQAAEAAAKAIKPDGLALTLQNGLGNLETLAQHVGAARAALGVTMQGATTDGPGVLRLGGSGPTYLATRAEIAPQVAATAALFERAGFEVHIVDDVTGLMWGKLAINAAINPMAALLRITNGALLSSAWVRQVMRQAAQEVCAVAKAQGITLPFPDAAAQAERVAEMTGANRASMLQDVLRGAETEIEAICGAVVQAGQKLGVPTPTNALLHCLVKSLEETQARRIP